MLAIFHVFKQRHAVVLAHEGIPLAPHVGAADYGNLHLGPDDLFREKVLHGLNGLVAVERGADEQPLLQPFFRAWLAIGMVAGSLGLSILRPQRQPTQRREDEAAVNETMII